MSLIQAIILGIVQGLTEFLPISSSAHLVLVPFWLNWQIPADQAFSFDVLVQVGTLVAVIAYFWKDLWLIVKSWIMAVWKRKPFASIEARLGWWLILASIPAVVVGLLIKDTVEAAFGSPAVTAGFLLVTALLLFLAEKIGKKQRGVAEMAWVDALVMGIGQALALFPGISRSGATISAGMFRNLDRSTAARFSFLMSVPVMLGAGALSILDLKDIQGVSAYLPSLIVGFLAAAIVGYLSIHWLLKLLQQHSLIGFAIYCAIVGVATLVFFSVKDGFSSSQTAEPPSLKTISVAYTPTVAWLLPELDNCARQQNGLGLVVLETSTDTQTSSNAEIKLRWGAPDNLSTSAFVIAEDSLVFVINPTHPDPSLNLETLKGIFSTSEGGFTVWRFPPDNEADGVLRMLLNLPPSPAGNEWLAMDMVAMRSAVARDSQAIGYLPSRWVDRQVKVITVDGIKTMAIPVLALTQMEPQGEVKSLLECLAGAVAAP